MTRRWLVVATLCIDTAAGSSAAVVRSARPRRWSEPLLGTTRDQVHALLGIPDAD